MSAVENEELPGYWGPSKETKTITFLGKLI